MMMAQDDMVIANDSGAAVRGDINAQLAALVSLSSGATAPGTTFAFQLWADTTTGLLKIRNSGNSAWIVVMTLATGGLIVGADIASGAALPVLADGHFNDVTGTTGITSIDALGVGTIKWLQFDGVVTITHHATNLVLPGGRNITTTAGQILVFYEYAAADWRLISNSLNGKVQQQVNVETGAVATTTTAMPFDDTIPQITEGAEFMTLAITPKSTNNYLLIEVVLQFSMTGSKVAMGLFKDADAGAIAAMAIQSVNNDAGHMILTHKFSGTIGVASITFRVRAGDHAGATLTFNGDAGARLMGGVLASSITITEYNN